MAESGSSPKSRDFDLYVAVAIGGVIGACARNAMELLIPTAHDGWPTATFIVNLSGAFILGVILIVAEVFFPDPKVPGAARKFRPFVVTGILGGYTTFSTYMVETHGLISHSETGLAIAYLLVSVVLGVLCVFLGTVLARAVLRQRIARQLAQAQGGEQ